MPYSCKHCNKCFSRSSVCKEHERIHTEVKPYKCRHCEKCFSWSSDYRIHEQTHTGEKLYTCKHCKKCFSDLAHCKRHERTHTGVKPYTCKHCKKCFSRSSSCKQHEEKHPVNSSLKHNQHGRYLREPSATQGNKKSSTEENLSQVKSHTCWICQGEFSSESCLLKHYDDHMR